MSAKANSAKSVFCLLKENRKKNTVVRDEITLINSTEQYLLLLMQNIRKIEA